MSDVLQHVYEYRKLLARQAMLGNKLDTGSRERLAALERLFAANPLDSHRRKYARCEVAVSATLKSSGRVHAVQVINMGGGGLCVQPAPQLRPGERAVVRIVSSETGAEYHYPVQAQWVHRTGSGSAMGLPFVGAPLQVSNLAG
jgi:hypothetical protein